MRKFNNLSIQPGIVGLAGVLCLFAGTAEAFTFIKVVDASTPIPDEPGTTFVLAGGVVAAPALEGDIVVFADDQYKSLWAAKLGDRSFTRLVDSRTPIPNREENFSFTGLFTIDQGVVAFSQGTDTLTGLYSLPAAGGGITTLVDQDTPVPGGTVNFINLNKYGRAVGLFADNGHLVFTHGSGNGSPPGNFGLYSVPLAGGAVQMIINDTFEICAPGFGFANSWTGVSGNTVVSLGGDVYGRNLVYTLPLSGAVGTSDDPCPFSDKLRVINHTIIAQGDTPTIPGTPVPDDSEGRSFDPYLFTDPVIDGDTIVFGGGASTENHPTLRGIYSSHHGGLSKLVDTNTPVPGGSGNFQFDLGTGSNSGKFALDGGQVVFAGTDANGRRGLYLVPATGGPITKIIAEGDPLGDGNTVNDFRYRDLAPIKHDSLKGGNLAFFVANAPFHPAIYVANLDTTPPDTQLTSAPPNPDSNPGPSFEFIGTDDFTFPADLSFECQLDGGGFAACASPKTYAGLNPGSHTFEVRAKDSAGNVDPTPATHAWTINAAGPTCFGQPATRVGTPGNDVLFGTPGRDVIVGLGGNDIIFGLAGNDLLCGGEGQDTLFGGTGDDGVDGGSGRDILFGNRGKDTCVNGEVALCDFQ